MSLTADPTRIPYELRPELEREAVRLAVVSETFWERAGKFWVAELLGADEARLIVEAVGEIAKEGRHPARCGGITIVLQRVQRKSTEAGRITRARAAACYDYLVSAPCEVAEDQAVAEVTPSIKRQLRQLQVKHAVEASSTNDPERRDIADAKLRSATAALDVVGVGKATFGDSSVTVDDIGKALALARLPRVPFGVPELDGLMRGGPQKGKFGFAVAYSGEGKSMLANHHACSAARRKQFAIYLTGEVVRGDEVLRMVSNLTGVPMDAAVDQPEWDEEMQVRYKWLLDNKQIVAPKLHHFKSTVTTANELFEIVAEEERRAGQRADLIYIDADEHVNYTKIDFPGLDKLAKKDTQNTYQGFGLLYAYFAFQAKGGQEDPTENPSLCRVVATLSQAKGARNMARFKVLTGEEAADSVRKKRIADWCLTLNWHPIQHGNVYYFDKGRQGGQMGSSTPALPKYYECAQVVRIKDDPYPWVDNPRGWKTKQHQFWPGV
jgi:hypothetical protein